MNRCLARAALACSFLVSALLAPLAAQAQSLGQTIGQGVGARQVPTDVKPGMLAIQNINGELTIDGKPDRYAPGIRVHDLNNMLVLTGTLVGRSVPAVYKRESISGQVHEVWLLTAEEYAKLGGINAGDPEGYKRLAELLQLIFAARLGLLR